MKKEREELVPKDLLDVLLDADNTEPVAFIDEDGRQTYFRQVAVIPFMCGDEKRLYALLAPLEAFDGVDTDSAIVFRVVSDGGTASRVRVFIRSTDGTHSFGTVGVSTSILQAAWTALVDSIDAMLLCSLDGGA